MTLLVSGCGSPGTSNSIATMNYDDCYQKLVATEKTGAKLDDASDHERAKNAYQQAIEISSQCFDIANDIHERSLASLYRSWSRLKFLNQMLDLVSEKGTETVANEYEDIEFEQLLNLQNDFSNICLDLKDLSVKDQNIFTDLVSQYAQIKNYNFIYTNKATPYPMPSSLTPSLACQIYTKIK
jgi:hypothetical protein